MIDIIDGDLFENGAKLIAHQVNCMGVMGGGVALTVKKKYPFTYRKYMELCDVKSKDERKNLLGKIQAIRNDDGVIIINMFSQYSYGSAGLFTRYDQFRDCCVAIKEFMENEGLKELAMPYKIGCCRGGGHWDEVLPILEDVFGGDDMYLNLFRL